MKEVNKREFANGVVYVLQTDDGFSVEVTDTFLPRYTKDAIGRKQNKLNDYSIGSRKDRWMVGVSCMSGCPIRCKFCATGKLNKCRNLTQKEIVEQVEFVLNKNEYNFNDAWEHKINYTRMGEPFLNIDAVRGAIEEIDKKYPNTHHYISTIGIRGSDFSWIKDNITLQISVHSTDNDKRNWLIPYKKKMSYEELGKIRTGSNLKTTINMTLVDNSDFDINKFKQNFDAEYFFVKLSPINKNECSDMYKMGAGIIEGVNLI